MAEENKPLTYEEKVELFIKYYNEGKSGAESARLAGWSVNRAHITASELIRKPDIVKRLKQQQDTQRAEIMSGEGSVDTIIESHYNTVIKKLAENAASGDSKAVKDFTEFVFKHKKNKSEQLGEYDGASVRELILELNKEIEAAQKFKQLLLESFGEEAVPE